MRLWVGFDVGKAFHWVCVLDGEGEVLLSRRVEAIARAVDYWNSHRHPYIWGRRRRHRVVRKPGIGAMPTIPAVGT